MSDTYVNFSLLNGKIDEIACSQDDNRRVQAPQLSPRRFLLVF